MGLIELIRISKEQKFLREHGVTKEEYDVLNVLNRYGITVEDLKYLPQALTKVKEMSNNEHTTRKTVRTKEEKQVQDEIVKKVGKPEDFIQLFAGELEEYYPHGKATRNN